MEGRTYPPDNQADFRLTYSDQIKKHRLAPAEHSIDMIIGCLSQHVKLACAPTRFDNPFTPVENFVSVGHRDDRHGTVDMFARLHRLDTLGCMEPMLGNDGYRIDIGIKHFFQRIVPVAWIEFPVPLRP